MSLFTYINMSDKKEIENLNNLTKIDFKNKQVKFNDEFISKSEIHSILSQILEE